MTVELRRENDDLRAKLRNLISHATGGNMSDTDLPLNAIAVEISRLRTMIWNQAQESARKEDATLIEQLRRALGDIIDLDHHNMGPESRATKIARAALSGEH